MKPFIVALGDTVVSQDTTVELARQTVVMFEDIYEHNVGKYKIYKLTEVEEQ